MGSSRYHVTFSCAWHILQSVPCQYIQGCRGGGGRWSGPWLSGQEPSSPGPWVLVHRRLWSNISSHSSGWKTEMFLSLMVSPWHSRRLCRTELLSAEPPGHRWRPHHGGHQENVHGDRDRPGVYIYGMLKWTSRMTKKISDDSYFGIINVPSPSRAFSRFTPAYLGCLKPCSALCTLPRPVPSPFHMGVEIASLKGYANNPAKG